MAAAACGAAGGCSPFAHVTDWGNVTALRPLSSTAPEPRDTVQVEVLFVERTLDDPSMGDALWRDLDQVGAVESATRARLATHGFRVGHCGSTPPRALQRLLGMRAQIVETGAGAAPRNMHGQRIGLPAGDDYEIQTSPVYPACEMRLDPADESATRSFRSARCVLRLSAKRLQEGWVRLDLQPEIHHGDHRLRRLPGEGGFQLRQSQEVVPVYGLRFPMELGTGEFAVVGHAPSSTPRSLGRHFLVGHTDDAQLQRLLVLRVAGVGKGRLVSAE